MTSAQMGNPLKRQLSEIETAQHQVIRLGRQLLALSLGGTASLALYLHFYGGGNIVVVLFIADFVLWASTIICGLVGPMLTYRSAVHRTAKNKEWDRHASHLMFIGIFLSLLPGPWAFVMTRILGNSRYVTSPIIMIPTILFLTAGFGLILYRVFVAMTILSQNMKHRPGIENGESE